MEWDRSVKERRRAVRAGGPAKYHERLRAQGKRFVRDRLAELLDPGFEVEDGLFARFLDEGLPADGVVTLTGKIGGRFVEVIANDMTVKAGSWGRLTVAKILRAQELAWERQIPVVYLVDSAGARLDEQFDIFLGRRHAGKIFWNLANMSGVVPQIAVMFGASTAGSAYLPALCDLVVMVDKNASVYLGSPRMVEMATGERVTMEEMGGARMHCTVSGLGDLLVESESEALAVVRRYLSYFPSHFRERPPSAAPREPEPGPPIEEILPEDYDKPFDMHALIRRVVDAESLFELKPLFAPELICALARLDGEPVGVVATNPAVKGGVLFPESADKGAWFINLMDAFNLPLLFFQDVAGFMIGSAVERRAIIRRGAKMLVALAQATVPRISVLVRKVYGATYMALGGASFQSDACIALPQAKPAIMGPEAAVNAIFYNQIQAITDPAERARFVQDRRREYLQRIDVWQAASEFLVDAVVPGSELREELRQRLELYRYRREPGQAWPPRKHPVVRG
jgi:acetyl-CoA carboxylase carboxyltransferase component